MANTLKLYTTCDYQKEQPQIVSVATIHIIPSTTYTVPFLIRPGEYLTTSTHTFEGSILGNSRLGNGVGTGAEKATQSRREDCQRKEYKIVDLIMPSSFEIKFRCLCE